MPARGKTIVYFENSNVFYGQLSAGWRIDAVDTSRVALALARARIMGSRDPYYLLADSETAK